MDYVYKAVPITVNIIDEDQRLVEGYLGDDKIDIDGHIIPRDVYQRAINEYIPWGNIREMHKAPVGTVVDYGTKAWNHIVVKVIDDHAWTMVKNGVYKGFSIGARVIAKSWISTADAPIELFAGIPETIKNAIQEVGKILRIDSMVLTEISLVDRPINPRALITAYKGFDASGDETLLEVEKHILDAQIEMFKKGENIMAAKDEKVLNDEAQVEDVVTKGEPVEDRNDNEDTAVEKTDVVEEDAKVEPKTEANLEPEVEDVVEKGEDEFNYQSAYEDIVQRVDLVEKGLDSLTQDYHGISDSLEKALAGINTLLSKSESTPEAVEEDAAVAEAAPEFEESVEESKGVDETANQLEDIITKAVDAAMSKYVETKTVSQERQNVVNKGDIEQEPQEPALDFGSLPRNQKYNALARMMAQQATS